MSRLPVKQPQHGAVNDVSNDGCDRSPTTVMKSQVSGRLELSCGIGTAEFVGHPWMNARKNTHTNEKNEHRVYETDRGAKPPEPKPGQLKRFNVNKRERPSIDEVDQDSEPLRAVAIGCEHGSQHEWKIHSCEPQTAATAHQSCQNDRARKTPK